MRYYHGCMTSYYSHMLLFKWKNRGHFSVALACGFSPHTYKLEISLMLIDSKFFEQNLAIKCPLSYSKSFFSSKITISIQSNAWIMLIKGFHVSEVHRLKKYFSGNYFITYSFFKQWDHPTVFTRHVQGCNKTGFIQKSTGGMGTPTSSYTIRPTLEAQNRKQPTNRSWRNTGEHNE